MPADDATSEAVRELNTNLSAVVGESARLTHAMLTGIGDALAVRFGYEVDSIEACQRYVVDRYGWSPALVRGLPLDDLYFLLRELSTAVIPELPPPAFGAGDLPQSTRAVRSRKALQDFASSKASPRKRGKK